jgi:phosphatidylinositol alpha-1,6-mannosyltransferase
VARRKYLLVSPAYPPPFVGGSKVWTYNLVENCPEPFDVLTSALKPGCAEVISPRHGVFRSRFLWDANGADPTRFELLVSYTSILGWCARRLLRVRYDAVVAGAFDFANGWLFLLGKLMRVPVIGLGNAEEFTLALHGTGLRNFIKRQWMKFTHHRAAGFVVVCDFCKDVLVSIGVDPRRIHVVPSSINPNKLRPRSEWKRGGRHVLSVGRLVERKGFHHLIDAIGLLKTDLPDIRLTIVGDGPWRKTLEEQVARHGLAGHVAVRGGLSDEEVRALYGECDLFVLAHMMLENGDTEGCPTVFSEAAGNGLPVIGGTGGGAATAIVHGTTGYIVDSRNVAELADRIRAVLTDPRLAEAMGRAGMEKVRHDHDPAKCGVRFHESIRRIVEGDPRAVGPGEEVRLRA